MTPEQFAQFLKDNRESTAEAVRITVNGKIDKLTTKLDNHIENDAKWKENADPAIDSFNKTMIAFKMTNTVGKYFFGILIGIATLILAWLKIKQI